MSYETNTTETLRSPDLTKVIESWLTNRQIPYIVEESEICRLQERGVMMEDLLYELSNRGLLFHGSNSLIIELEPRAAHDEHDPQKSETGVYATSIPAIALYKATISEEQLFALHESITKGWSVAEDGSKAVNFYSTQPVDAARTTGYVHVLAPESFKEIDDGESVSFKKLVQS